jgi:hypothetical protein
MADDLAPIRNALTERAGDLAALVVEHARPQSRAKRLRNGKSSPSSEGAS